MQLKGYSIVKNCYSQYTTGSPIFRQQRVLQGTVLVRMLTFFGKVKYDQKNLSYTVSELWKLKSEATNLQGH